MISCERASKAIVAIETEEKSKENDWNEARQLRQKLADDVEVAQQMAEVETTRAKMVDTRQQQKTYLELGESKKGGYEKKNGQREYSSGEGIRQRAICFR